MIRDSYDTAFETLTPEEKKALLVRDGTDTMVDMYINTEQAKQNWK
jgi:hypothetical protein